MQLPIEPADHLKLTPEAWDRVCRWPTLRRQIEAREKAGFGLERMIVNGASFVTGRDENPILLTVQARVFYRVPGANTRQSYHVNFMPDAATLLVVFRTTNQEVTRRFGEISRHHVLMVKQPRYGLGDETLEIPGGLLNENETFDIGKSWNKLALGALREFTEEGIAPENRGIFPVIKPENIQSLGTRPMGSHPALTDHQYQFFTEIDTNPTALNRLTAAVNRSRAGNVQEQETTIVEIMPLRVAFMESLAQAEAPGTHFMLSRYMMMRNLLKFG